jgi:Sec-independent protein secretion pathway component TatC
MARGGERGSGSGSWRADVGWSLGLFMVGFVLTWNQREQLLGWSAEPLARAWRSAIPPMPPALLIYSPLYKQSFFLAYLSLATAGGVFAALPFVARLCSRVRPSVRARLTGFAFIVASYLVVSAGLVLAQYVAFPAVARWLLEPAQNVANERGPSFAFIPIEDYVVPAVAATVGRHVPSEWNGDRGCGR